MVCSRGGSVPAPFLGSPGGWRSSWLSLRGVTCWDGSAALLPALLATLVFPGWCAFLLWCGSLSRLYKYEKSHRKCRAGRTHQFPLISCIWGKRWLEKNASTVFRSILYGCFQCTPQKEAVSCRKYIILSSYRGEKNNFALALPITIVLKSRIA